MSQRNKLDDLIAAAAEQTNRAALEGISSAARPAMGMDKWALANRALVEQERVYSLTAGRAIMDAHREALRAAGTLHETLVHYQSWQEEIARHLDAGRSASLTLNHIDEIVRGFRDHASLVFKPLMERPAWLGEFLRFNSGSSVAEDFLRGCRESTIDALDNMRGIAASLSQSQVEFPRERPMPLLPVRKEQQIADGVEAFMTSFKKQYQETQEQAEEEGGRVGVYSKTPTGDTIVVSQVSRLDAHFVIVTGFDVHKQRRSFKAHFSAVQIAMEVAIDDEEFEEDEDDLLN